MIEPTPQGSYGIFLIPSLAVHMGIMAIMPDIGEDKPEPELRVEISLEEAPPEVIEELPPPPPPPPTSQPQPEPEPDPEPEPELEPEPVEAPEPEPAPTPVKPVEAPKVAAAPGVQGGVVGGVVGGVLGGKIGAPPPPPPLPKPKPAPPAAINVNAAIQASRILVQIPPQYPRDAKQFRIQGTVKLKATINKTGAVETVDVLDGHPMLVDAAVMAVERWKYRPTILRGAPVSVNTQIHVNFSLRRTRKKD